MSKIRCFCAVDISEEVKNRLVDFRSEIEDCFEKVSWTRIEGMHITIKFLGEQDESKIEEVSQAFSDVSGGFSRFEVEFGGMGFFPGVKRPRVIWIGVKRGLEKLVALNEMVEERLARLKIPREKREFHPHLTLGRIKRCEPNSARYKELIIGNQDRAFGVIEADRLCFFQSILKPEGAEYIKLGTYEFN